MSWKVALAGAGALGAGLVKMRQHMASADPFAAYWCRTPGSEDALTGGGAGEWLLLGHCWGCYVAAIGAAMLIMAGWKRLQSSGARVAIGRSR